MPGAALIDTKTGDRGMIGIYEKIPFHGQLKRSDQKLSSELAQATRQIAASFGATLQPLEESFLLLFDDKVLPCRLRAAEAARLLTSRLKALSPRLHGWAVILDMASENGEDVLKPFKRHWYGIAADGLFLGPAALQAFAPYFRTEAGSAGPCIPVVDAPYATPALPAEGSVPGPDERAIGRLEDEIGELGVGDSPLGCIAILGPGSQARRYLDTALERLYKADAGGFLRFRAAADEISPYGPIVEGLARLVAPSAMRPGPAELLSGAERGLLEELAPILDFLRRSPYRAGYSPTLDVRFRLRAAAAFRLYARERRYHSLPAFVVLEGIERFPPETVALIADLLLGKQAEEGIAVLAAGSALPPYWPAGGTRRATMSAPAPSVIARAAREAAEYLRSPELAARLAAAAAGDPFRLRLAQRLAAAGRAVDPALSTPRLAAAALSTLPPEYASFFLALRIGEGVLGDEDMGDFLDSIGMVQGVRPLICSTLAELSLAEGAPRPRITLREGAAAIEEAIEDGGASIAAAFSARLLELHEKRRILPSTALYERIASGDSVGPAGGKPYARETKRSKMGSLKLLLDCLAADAVYGRSEVPGKTSPSPLGAMGDFLAAYAACERDKAQALLADLESSAADALVDPSEAPALRGALALARSAADYADRKPQAAAATAKTALIDLHSQGVRRSEARAQRLLGLCALAQEQVQQSADYLANAYEVAEAVPDPLECILAAQGEASAHFVLGDLKRALLRVRTAASWAGKAFRADWETACAFMEGRINLELGRSAEAEESFGRIRAEARVYGRDDAASRAEIWTGRAAAWAGEGERAQDLLGRHDSDAEALWFRAELAIWEHKPDTAFALAERALAALPPRDYPSADTFFWSSGFESIEGRAVGFCSGRSYLEDQILAFRDFAAGLAAPETEAANRASLLALRAREERLAALHPAAHLFLFYRYLLLERCSPSSMDGATALSKAFKALQLRSARMEEASLKDAFIEGNRWNRDLFAQAKARKFI